MIKLKSLLAGLLLGGFFIASAAAQHGVGQLGPGQVYANPTAAQSLGQPTGLSPLMNRGFCSTTANFLANIGGTWGCATFSAELGFTGSVLGLVSIPASTPASGSLLFTNIVAPGTPAAGKIALYGDSSNATLAAKNAGGTVFVIPQTNQPAVSHQFLTGYGTAGSFTFGQPSFADISGSNTCAQEPALSGDVTSSAGACATTIAAAAVTFAKINSSAIATAAQWRNNTASLLLQTDQVWGAGAVVTLTDAATVTPDFSTGFNFVWTLGATGRTLASPTNVKVGQTGVIQIVEDGTGSRTITSYGSTWKFTGGIKPTLTLTAGATDLFTYFCYAAAACVINAVLNVQ